MCDLTGTEGMLEGGILEKASTMSTVETAQMRRVSDRNLKRTKLPLCALTVLDSSHLSRSISTMGLTGIATLCLKAAVLLSHLIPRPTALQRRPMPKVMLGLDGSSARDTHIHPSSPGCEQFT